MAVSGCQNSISRSLKKQNLPISITPCWGSFFDHRSAASSIDQNKFIHLSWNSWRLLSWYSPTVVHTSTDCYVVGLCEFTISISCFFLTLITNNPLFYPAWPRQRLMAHLWISVDWSTNILGIISSLWHTLQAILELCRWTLFMVPDKFLWFIPWGTSRMKDLFSMLCPQLTILLWCDQ